MSAEVERIINVEELSKSYRIWSSPAARLNGPLLERMAGWTWFPTGWRDLLRRKGREASREFHALRDVTFHVRRGESVGIVGRNGSGKSTLLGLIAGTLQPSGGEIQVTGRVAALLELGSGFNPEFTGRENVCFNAALYGFSRAETAARLETIFAFADIGDFVDQPVKTYSSGMVLRLAFAVIAHLDADILIIDEALAVGDAFFVQKCMTFLRRFQEHGVLLFVSHSMAAVTALCQKAIWLDGGRLRLNGSPKEVTEAYLETFFGEEAWNKRAVATEPVPGNRSHPDPAAEARTFNPRAASFGLRGGQVVDVRLEDRDRNLLGWVEGGEFVTLRIWFHTTQPFVHPIIGFYVKNSLGQQIFGDNTFMGSRRDDMRAEPQARFEARFHFQMPYLPPGDYLITVALADGSQSEHEMHHWIHDALAFKSISSPLRPVGLLGLPSMETSIQRLNSPLPEAAVANA